jgi:hypothetical protein
VSGPCKIAKDARNQTTFSAIDALRQKREAEKGTRTVLKKKRGHRKLLRARAALLAKKRSPVGRCFPRSAARPQARFQAQAAGGPPFTRCRRTAGRAAGTPVRRVSHLGQHLH